MSEAGRRIVAVHAEVDHHSHIGCTDGQEMFGLELESTLHQLIVSEILNDSAFLGDHLEFARDPYARRARTLHAAVGDFVDALLPRGGMFLWGRAEVDTTQALDCAVAAGVAYVPGDAFFVDDRSDRWLRLSFATLEEAALTEAADRLRSALAGDPTRRRSVPNQSEDLHRPTLQ